MIRGARRNISSLEVSKSHSEMKSDQYGEKFHGPWMAAIMGRLVAGGDWKYERETG